MNGDKRLHVLQPILFVILKRNMQIYSLRVYIASLSLWILSFSGYWISVTCSLYIWWAGWFWFVYLFVLLLLLLFLLLLLLLLFCFVFLFPSVWNCVGFLNQHYTKVNHLLTFTFSLILTYIFTYLSTSLTYFPTCLLTSLTYV